MTENERFIITSVWNDMVLRKRFDENPYSLEQSELKALSNNDRLNNYFDCLKDKDQVRKAPAKSKSSHGICIQRPTI
jgi:hypothetical protein